MKSAPKEPGNSRSQEDRLTRRGWIATAVWSVVIGGSALYFWGFRELGDGGAFGDFFAGMAAPLAFLWLVISYLLQRIEFRLQRQELALQREEIARQREETHRLADASTASADSARRDLATRTLEVGIPELEELSHVIFHRWLRRFPNVGEHYVSWKSQFDASDRRIFIRGINDRMVDVRDPLLNTYKEKVLAEPILGIWVLDFIKLYDMLRSQANEAGMREFFDTLPHIARFYETMKAVERLTPSIVNLQAADLQARGVFQVGAPGDPTAT